MKIKLQNEQLLKGLDYVSKAISGKTTQPILEGVLIKAEKDVVILKASDIDTSITCTLEANVESEGSAVIDYELLKLLKKFNKGDIEFVESSDNKVEITSGKTKADLAILGKEKDFLSSAPIEQTNSFSILGSDFKKLVKDTIYAVATEETRPILTGVLFKCEGKKLNLVGLDGYRLAVDSIDIDCDKDFELVVPSKIISHISQMIPDEEIKVYYTNNRVEFVFNNIIVSSSLLEGKYVNYSSLIPQEFETIVTVDSKAFKDSIDKCSGFKDQTVVIVDITKDTIKVSTFNSQFGKVEDEVSCVSSGELKIGFNPKYLTKCLETISGDVELNFVGELKPLVIKSPQDENLMGLILPVRLQK